jgi:hypothetical protein
VLVRAGVCVPLPCVPLPFSPSRVRTICCGTLWCIFFFFLQANLSVVVGRPDSLRQMLQARGDAMAALIRDNLWDDSLQTFVNKFPNGSFYPRISPTSFYALQALAATDAQADAMVWCTLSVKFSPGWCGSLELPL